MVYVSLMIPASFIDLDHMIIPDRFSTGGMLAGLVLCAAVPVLHGFEGEIFLLESMRALTVSLQGAFTGSALILWIMIFAEIILRKEAMGFGDVKLMGAIGAFCGWQGAVFAVFGGAALGTVIYLPVLAFQKDRTSAAPDGGMDAGDEEEDIRGRVPFGPMLALGGLLYFLWFHPMADAYFEEISTLLFGVRTPWPGL